MKHTASAALLLVSASAVSAHDLRHAHPAKRQDNAAVGTPEVPPLPSITFGMPSAVTLAATATYTPGAQPPISGAPPLPTAFVYSSSDWPVADITPPTDSPQVLAWLKELDGHTIPDIPPTPAEAACTGDSFTNSAANGWWTCTGTVRDTDIVACPDKMTWGVSFDDGPSEFTQTLLEYLDQEKLKATFFVVGSRVIEQPAVLLEEYMSGHEISVHTWAHPHLTTLTTEQVVAELGWARHAIQTVLGVTPTTMRPPYGDIDDRVRAISLAMGLTPIIWTSSPASGPFDTNDWRVAGGLLTGEQQQATFQGIMGNASTLDTGFIVLEHDLFEITVDLARGYTIPAALAFQPPITMKPIGECLGWPASNMYLETTTNTTSSDSASNSSATTSAGTTGSVGTSGSKSSTAASTASPSTAVDANQASGALSAVFPSMALLAALSAVLIGAVSL